MQKKLIRKSKKTTTEDVGSTHLLYMNTPITDSTDDIIGIETYVGKLDAAIDSGAQMIAITSPFGSGKSSIVELLKIRRAGKRKKEKILKVSMWSQLDSAADRNVAVELHRTFLYQLISQISHRRGTYVSRRLSPNYGLLKLHVNKRGYWFMFAVSLVSFVLFWLLKSFPEQAKSWFPKLVDSMDRWKIFLLVLGAVFMLAVITLAEVVFSKSHKAEVQREIEFSEIVDVYRGEVLKYPLWNWWRKKVSKTPKIAWLLRKKKYIVIIEDLDRTNDVKAVENFLKELRKYYIPQSENGWYCNEVTFIVNIKPEALLRHESKSDGHKGVAEAFYAKLFDYVLNLQTINIDNYDSILENLLQEKKAQLSALGFETDGQLSNLSGMKWLIREPGVGMRQIKERLNITFTLFESLKNRFKSTEKNFGTLKALEKCAVVAYLTTAFEQDFYKTDDHAFQKLINLYFQDKLNDDGCQTLLPGTSIDYQKAVQELIKAKQIDTNYRTYFYNYPKDSYLYNSDETQVIDAILYKADIDSLEQIATQVAKSNSFAISYALNTIKQLGLPLPDTVFSSETLYIEALKDAEPLVLQFIQSLDYSEEAAARTTEFLKIILSYDKERTTFNAGHAAKICAILEKTRYESVLLRIRGMLCKEFPQEIMWYKDLFGQVHALITQEEMASLSLADSTNLLDRSNPDFSMDSVLYIMNRFSELDFISAEKNARSIERFLRSIKDDFDSAQMIPLYLGFMERTNRIVPDFELEVYNYWDDEDISDAEKQRAFKRYQNIINNSPDKLSPQTIKQICTIDEYEGFRLEIADQVKEAGRMLEYSIIQVCNGGNIDFEDDLVRNSLEEGMAWLTGHKKYFMPIRAAVANCPWSILENYAFMFSSTCPILTETELHMIESREEECEAIVIKLVPTELVNEDNYQMLVACFNRRKQTKMTYDILMYISRLPENVVSVCFYALDFDNIRYRYIARPKQLSVIEAFRGPLSLDGPIEKIRFMKATRFLDEKWELELQVPMRENAVLERDYVGVVNLCDKLSPRTIETYCALRHYYGMSPLVNNALFAGQKYKSYVCSVTEKNRCFELPSETTWQQLWPACLSIFASQAYSSIREYMVQNLDFLRRIMDDRAYVGLEEENRMQLCGIYQDQNSITNVMEYGDDFALEYYSKIAGFIDRVAAETFVAIVTDNDTLLASDSLYNHIHEKLIDGHLKAKYTNRRKKAGYMS